MAAISPGDLAERLASALLDEGHEPVRHDDGNYVLHAGADSLFDDARSISILQAPTAIERLPDLELAGITEVVVLGGSEELRARLREAQPKKPKGLVFFFHVDDDGEVGRFGKAHESNSILGPMVRRRHELPEIDSEAFAARWIEELRRHVEQRVGSIDFERRHGWPVATIALAAALVVFYVLSMLWGGAGDISTLLRMGALAREQPLLDEPWRLLSCTVLSRGLMDLLNHAILLLFVGTMLERRIGRYRTLVLFVVAGLGGSVASTMVLSEGFSVGASGAIGGLVGALVMLTVRPAGLLPPDRSPAMRRGTLVAIAGVSVGVFEMVVESGLAATFDWVATLGGGTVGALVMLTGLLAAGLPRFGESPAAGRGRLGWARPAAILSVGLLALASALAMIHGAPWR